MAWLSTGILGFTQVRLRIAARARDASVCLFFCFIAQSAMGQALTLIAGGDVHWSDGSRHEHIEGVYRAGRRGIQIPIPWGKGWVGIPWDHGWIGAVYHFDGLSDLARKADAASDPALQAWLEEQEEHAGQGLQFSNEEARVRYPFTRIRSVISKADIGFANLETPLSERGRRVGLMFRAPSREL